jgi:hypothetical protein
VRAVAAAVFLVMLVLSAGDALFCADGCRQTHSTRAADDCNARGTCHICAGAVLQPIAAATLEPMPLLEILPVPSVVLTALSRSRSIDHPPRLG